AVPQFAEDRTGVFAELRGCMANAPRRLREDVGPPEHREPAERGVFDLRPEAAFPEHRIFVEVLAGEQRRDECASATGLCPDLAAGTAEHPWVDDAVRLLLGGGVEGDGRVLPLRILQHRVANHLGEALPVAAAG